jgi:phospholipid/cholesterol/gamma-HCH transport system substrate-binding protein
VKRFRERDPVRLGLGSLAALALAIVLSLNFSRLPLVSDQGSTYRADFVSSGGLHVGDVVTIAGVRVGHISTMALHGDHVRISFLVRGVHIGPDTTVDAKVLSPVGQEYLEVNPSGTGRLKSGQVIPISQTTVPTNLIGDLSQLTAETEQYDISQLIRSMQVGSSVLNSTPASETAAALSGLARFSQVLANRQQELGTLVSQGAQLSRVLADRTGQIVSLVGQGDLVLQVLNDRRQVIQQLLQTTTGLSNTLSGILTNDGSALNSLLSNLNTVSALLAHDSTSIGNAMPLLAAFNKYAANVTGSGPFVDFTVPTLLVPDNVIAQCGALNQQAALPPALGCRP